VELVFVNARYSRDFLEIRLDGEGELVDEVRQEHESQNSLLKDILLAVDEPAGAFKGFTDLKFVVQRTVLGSLRLKAKNITAISLEI
jgi:hypothetical protein